MVRFRQIQSRAGPAETAICRLFVKSSSGQPHCLRHQYMADRDIPNRSGRPFCRPFVGPMHALLSPQSAAMTMQHGLNWRPKLAGSASCRLVRHESCKSGQGSRHSLRLMTSPRSEVLPLVRMQVEVACGCQVDYGWSQVIGEDFDNGEVFPRSPTSIHKGSSI